MKNVSIACGLTLALLWSVQGQRGGDVSWAPKPDALSKYTPPHRPHTKRSELKQKNAGKKEWTYRVVEDDHFTVDYIFSPAGTKVPRRFHPDTRAWWIVLEGDLRFDIEGEQSITAGRRAMVQVPAQTLYSIETGDAPSLRLEVNIAKAKTLYPKDIEPPKLPGMSWIPVQLGRKPFGYSDGNRPMVTFEELAAQAEKKRGTIRVVHDDRGVANFIYGYAKNLPPYNPKNKGHYHPECAEFWLIMAGQIMYPIEGQPAPIIADEGDLVYVPKFTFHAPRWHGDGPSCRLAMNGYPNISHLFEAQEQ